VLLQANSVVTLLAHGGDVPCMLCSPRQETLRWSPLLTQICARHQWRHAKVKSDGSGSNGLTPYNCLCYHFCALEHGT